METNYIQDKALQKFRDPNFKYPENMPQETRDKIDTVYRMMESRSRAISRDTIPDTSPGDKQRPQSAGRKRRYKRTRRGTRTIKNKRRRTMRRQ